MNKKKILKLTAAAMAMTTVGSLNQGRIVKAVENNVQLSELDVKDESLGINDKETGEDLTENDEKISDEENAIVSEEQKGDELEKSNFEIKTQTSTGSSVEPVSWSFDDSNEGWNFGGAYSYNGPQDNVVNFDEEKQGLRLDVDYSKNVGDSWSEFKIEKKFEGEKLKLNGYNVLTYDFIYDPNCMTTGTFKVKLFITDGPNKDVAIDLSNAEDLGNGLKKAQAVVEFNNADIEADSIILGLVGSNTDYKGSIYIDNIKLSQAAQEDPYVEKTAEPVKQGLVSVDSLEMPSEVKLVDNEATQVTADLYAYLKALGKTDKVIYGHQNDTHHKALYKQGTNSDTKDVTGSIAGIIGMDTLSFTGDELELTDEEKKEGLTLPKKAAQIDAQAAKEGAIITLSSHMPNFEIVKNKELVDGKYDYSGYSPNKTSGNIVSRIMPGGDLNEVYTGYLDLIAEYADELQKENVPVLFRPFHENNGSWFWWGGAFCDAQSYKNLLDRKSVV